MALHNQLGNLRSFNDLGEVSAETAAIAATWRGGQPEHFGFGIVLDNLAVGVRGGVVAFVDDNQVCRRHRHCVRAHTADPQCRYRGHLHAFHRTKPVVSAGHDDPVPNAIGLQLARSLIVISRRWARKRTPRCCSAARLAIAAPITVLPAGRRDEDHLLPRRQGRLSLRDGCPLIWAKIGHRRLRSSPAAIDRLIASANARSILRSSLEVYGSAPSVASGTSRLLALPVGGAVTRLFLR